jgi:hypothetical protein
VSGSRSPSRQSSPWPALWGLAAACRTQANLLELAAPLRTGASANALGAYVIRKLHNAQNTRLPPGGLQ